MQRRNRWRTALIFGLTGWLFADLFIGMTMIFIANTRGYAPVATPTVTIPAPPTPTITPTATPQPALSLKPITIKLTVDAQGIANGDAGAIADAEQQIKDNSSLRCKLAGLVLTFGGSPTAGDTGFALQVARAIDGRVFPDLGRQHYVFDTAVYREFFNLGTSSNTIQADVYVFKNVNSC